MELRSPQGRHFSILIHPPEDGVTLFLLWYVFENIGQV